MLLIDLNKKKVLCFNNRDKISFPPDDVDAIYKKTGIMVDDCRITKVNGEYVYFISSNVRTKYKLVTWKYIHEFDHVQEIFDTLRVRFDL